MKAFLSDPYKWISDLQHCCTFLMLPEVKELITDLDKELATNAELFALTTAEATEWRAIALALQNETLPQRLQTHAARIVSFWTAYQKVNA